MIQFEYKTEYTYPDLLDLERVLRGMDASSVLKKKYDAPKLFQDFAASFDWMHCVLPCLHYHGKHSFENALNIKEMAERFIGRRLRDDGFEAAVVERGLQVRKASLSHGHYLTDKEIKVPPLDRAIEFLPRWNEYILERKEREQKKCQLNQSGAV